MTEHKLKEYVYGRDLLDLICDFGRWGGTPQEFVSVLRKMPPRLYSISSSLAANPDEVHVTVGVVRYTAHGRQRKGVCSNFCAERLQPGVTVPVFIQENDSFRLPDDPDTPIITIGLGMGRPWSRFHAGAGRTRSGGQIVALFRAGSIS